MAQATGFEPVVPVWYATFPRWWYKPLTQACMVCLTRLELATARIGIWDSSY